MSSWQINPLTGDYQMENGAPIPSDSLDNPAYYRIAIPRLQWMYAPNTSYGSDLNTIQKKTGNQALGMISRALAPMIADGRAVAVDPEFAAIQPSSRNAAAIDVNITDAQGTTTTLSLPPIGI